MNKTVSLIIVALEHELKINVIDDENEKYNACYHHSLSINGSEIYLNLHYMIENKKTVSAMLIHELVHFLYDVLYDTRSTNIKLDVEQVATLFELHSVELFDITLGLSERIEKELRKVSRETYDVMLRSGLMKIWE